MNQDKNSPAYRQANMRQKHSKWQSVYDTLLAKVKEERVSIQAELKRMKVVRQDLYLWMTEEQKVALKTAKMEHATYYGAKKAPGRQGKYANYEDDEAVLINGKLVDVSRLKKAA